MVRASRFGCKFPNDPGKTVGYERYRSHSVVTRLKLIVKICDVKNILAIFELFVGIFNFLVVCFFFFLLVLSE